MNKSNKLSKKLIILIIFLFSVVIIYKLFFSNSRSNKQNNPSYSEVNQQEKTTTDEEPFVIRTLSDGSEMLSDGSIVKENQEVEKKDTTLDKFDYDAYKAINYDEFLKFLSSHFDEKKSTNFKGASIFNSAYKFKITLPYKPIVIPNELSSVLDSATMDKEISKMFTHYFEINQQEISIYFFIQNKLSTDILEKWDEAQTYELYVFMPLTNHYSNYVPLLVNATSN